MSKSQCIGEARCPDGRASDGSSECRKGQAALPQNELSSNYDPPPPVAVAPEPEPTLPPSEAPGTVAWAKGVAHKTFNAWKAGRFVSLGDSFAANMQAELPPRKQRNVDQLLRERFGEYVSMEYAETHPYSTGGKNYKIHRFRGVFTGTTDRPEVRIVLDSQGRVAGLFVRPWLKKLQ